MDLGEAASAFAGEVRAVLNDVLALQSEVGVIAEELNSRYVIGRRWMVKFRGQRPAVRLWQPRWGSGDLLPLRA